MKFYLLIILLVVFPSLSIGQIPTAAAPSASPEKPKLKFGSSLKKFGKKDKNNSNDDKDKNEATNKDKNEAANEETIRIETDLMTNDVLVVDKQSRVVTNLQAKDFIITENGVEQQPELFSFGTDTSLPRSIVLVIYSSFLPYQSVKNGFAGADILVDDMAPHDRMAIVSAHANLVLDFTSDKDLLKKTLKNMPSELLIKSKEYGALLAVLEELFNEKDVRPIVIFQTGGGELFGLRPDADSQPASDYSRKVWRKFNKEREYGFSDVIERVRKSRATIYSIIPGRRFVGLSKEEQIRRARAEIEEWARIAPKVTDPGSIAMMQDKYQSREIEDDVACELAVMKVAELSGGYTEFIEKPEDAGKIYDNIFATINNRYTVGYYSTNQEKDGKERNVKIQVRDHPEYTILYKEKYFMR